MVILSQANDVMHSGILLLCCLHMTGLKSEGCWCFLQQVSPVPGPAQRAAPVHGLRAGQVLLQGVPEEALAERAQAAMHHSSITEAPGRTMRELHYGRRFIAGQSTACKPE